MQTNARQLIITIIIITDLPRNSSVFLISNQMNKGGDWGRSGVVVAGVGWWWQGGGGVGVVVVENVLESRRMKMKASTQAGFLISPPAR